MDPGEGEEGSVLRGYLFVSISYKQSHLCPFYSLVDISTASFVSIISLLSIDGDSRKDSRSTVINPLTSTKV